MRSIRLNGRILAIVPAYNEEKNIEAVIGEIASDVSDCDVIVINDKSKDGTSLRARNGKAVVIDLPHNLGIGGAVQTGFLYAVRNDYSYVVQVDGDGQHVASEIGKLLEKMKSADCNVVIGSRFLDVRSFRTSFLRRAGIRLFSCIYRTLLRIRITDGTSGFRMYDRKAFEYLSERYPDDYPEPEAIIMLAKKKFRICEIGVRMRERQSGESSITAWKSIYYMIKVVLSMFMTFLRKER
jgi:glycosyltransferase involved in cell wall biosynthesis